MMMMTSAQRDAVVAEALSWVGTPYHHLAAVKGAGVDCAMLLVAVYQAVGMVAANYDPRPYAPQWFLHHSRELYREHLASWAEPITDPGPGDVAVYRFGRTASHGAIIVDKDLMVHAYRPRGRVEITEMRALAQRLDSYWRVAA